MKLSLSYIPIRLYPMIILGVTYALLQTAAFYPLVSFPLGMLFIKGLIDSAILMGMGMLLGVVIPSSNYVRLDVFQRFVNFFALGLLFLFFWVLLGYLSALLLLGISFRDEIRSLIPLTAFLGMLMYVIYAQVIHFRMIVKDAERQAKQDEELADDAVALQHAAEDGAVNEETELLERVAVKIGQKIHVVFVQDIIYIQSDGDYVQIVTENHKFPKEETMKYFEAGLPSSQFVRVHRSYIVNVEKILRIEIYEKQSQMLILKNGDKIRASVSGYRVLKAVLDL